MFFNNQFLRSDHAFMLETLHFLNTNETVLSSNLVCRSIIGFLLLIILKNSVGSTKYLISSLCSIFWNTFLLISLIDSVHVIVLINLYIYNIISPIKLFTFKVLTTLWLIYPSACYYCTATK